VWCASQDRGDEGNTFIAAQTRSAAQFCWECHPEQESQQWGTSLLMAGQIIDQE